MQWGRGGRKAQKAQGSPLHLVSGDPVSSKWVVSHTCVTKLASCSDSHCVVS